MFPKLSYARLLRLVPLALLVPCFAHLSSAETETESLPFPFTKRLVAFYGSWSKFNVPSYSSAQIPYNKLTHIIHAGINLNEPVDGSFNINTYGYLEPELLSKAHAADIKVLFYVGANNGYDYTLVTSSPQFRSTFLKNLREVVKKYGYDGVDIDWEYPNGPVDFVNFVTFIREIRNLFDPSILISTDIRIYPSSGVDFDHLNTLVSWFNIMMYDAAGPWTGDVQMNSPIFDDPANPNDQGAVDQAATDFVQTYNVPPEQLNMGTPFYGYDYMNQRYLYQNCDIPCTDDNVPSLNYGTQIKPLVNKQGWVRHWNTVQSVPYLVRADGSNGFITYDDPESTYDRIYYSDWMRGFGGSMMWELSADYDGKSQDLLEAMYVATLGIRRNAPW